MRKLTIVLLAFSVLIYGVTLAAAAGHGLVWPATFFPDLVALDWRSQFNADLLMHLILLGAWACWREGGGAWGYTAGISCVVWGGMFSFPYLLYLGWKAGGRLDRVLLGVHHAAQARDAGV